MSCSEKYSGPLDSMLEKELGSKVALALVSFKTTKQYIVLNFLLEIHPSVIVTPELTV